MAVSGLWFENGLNKEVWNFYKKCGCRGILTYKYANTVVEKRELWIYPNRKQFRVLQVGKTISFGSIADMISKLNSL